MKHLYCALLLALASLGPLAAFAQPASPGPLDSLRQDLAQLFAPLDLAQVPAPYLDSYGLPLLPLRPYNGTASFGS